MGAIAGGVAGGYAGHKVHHGFLGTLGGAYAGHKLEEAYKEHHQHKKPPSPVPPSAPVPESHPNYNYNYGGGEPLRGNFSASAHNITLDRDYDLIAECTAVDGHKRLSSISLNKVLTNDNGHFRWVSSGGNFGASARDVRLIDGGKVLEAELADVGGNWKRSRIVLDERIENSDGDLNFLS
jgi:CVNH domain